MRCKLYGPNPVPHIDWLIDRFHPPQHVLFVRRRSSIIGRTTLIWSPKNQKHHNAPGKRGIDRLNIGPLGKPLGPKNNKPWCTGWYPWCIVSATTLLQNIAHLVDWFNHFDWIQSGRLGNWGLRESWRCLLIFLDRCRLSFFYKNFPGKLFLYKINFW